MDRGSLQSAACAVPAEQITVAVQSINLTEVIDIMDMSNDEIAYWIEFLRQADIRQITLWEENPDGSPRIIERKLIATLKIAEDAPAAS